MNRRPGFRGIGSGGGGASPFSPFSDPDLIGVWDPADATDNGTTYTVPNQVSGGPAFASTGVSRATSSPTGLAGRPGFTITTVGVDSAAGVGDALVGKTGCTIFQTGVASAQTAAYFHRYGTTANGDFRTLVNQPSSGRTQVTLEAATNRVWQGTPGSIERLQFPQVLCFRYDTIALAALWSDGGAGVGVFSGTEPGGALLDKTFSWGSANGGATPFPGVNGPLIIVARTLTDAEVPVWTEWYEALIGQTTWRNVFWTGDSITACNMGGGAQWRGLLQAAIDGGAAPSWYRSQGPFTAAATPFALDYANAGGGNTIALTETNLATYNFGTVFQSGPRKAVFPILLGTNDIAVSGLTNAQIATAYGSLLDTIVARIPLAKCIVQKLLPRGDSHNTQVQDLNDNFLATVVSDAVSRGIDCELDDTFATMPGITYLDSAHPDAASGAAMAAAIEPRLRTWAGVP